MTTKKKRKAAVPVKFDASILNNPKFSNALLIVAVLVPIVSMLAFWSQEGFKTPMSVKVFDSVGRNPAIFPAFLVLVVASFWLQYRSLPAGNKRKMLGKTPILMFLGIGVAVVSLALIWWRSPADTSTRTIISQFANTMPLSGSVAALTLVGIILAFFVLKKEEQKRLIWAVMIPVSALLIFGGPTYVLLFLQKLEVPYIVRVPIGLASFTAGLIIFLRLIKEEVKP